jgi:hypothetical protein
MGGLATGSPKEKARRSRAGKSRDEVVTLGRPPVRVDTHEKSPAHLCPANGKYFMRWRGSLYRKIADRGNRFIAPIRAGSSEWWTSPRLQRDCDEWTEVLRLPADTRPKNQTDHPWNYRGNT